MLQKMQVGEYELTVTDVTLIVIMLVALKRVLTWLMAGKVTEPKKYEVGVFLPKIFEFFSNFCNFSRFHR